jgi:hypothetical protein
MFLNKLDHVEYSISGFGSIHDVTSEQIPST